MYLLIVLEARNQRSGCWAGWVSPETFPVGCLPAPCSLTWSWPCASIPGISLCVPISSPYKDTGQVGWGLTLTASLLNHLTNASLQIQSSSEVGLQHMNLGVGGKEIARNRTQNLRCLWTSEGLVGGLQYKLELRVGLGMGK